MSRPTDWLPLNLGMDPVPGDWSEVNSASTRYGGIADAIERAKADLLRVFEDEAISGEAIDAVRETAVQVADRIGRAKKRYRGVADALAGYVQPLHTAQDRSVEILNQAIGVGGDQTHARTKFDEWEHKYYEATTPEELEDAEKWRNYWQQQLWDAENAVTSAVNELNQVLRDRDAAAETAAGLIEDVENSGDLNDGFWDNVDQFLDENPWIDTVLTIAGYVAAALAIIAMFVPGLNLIVLIVSIVVAAAVIANAWAKAGTGRSSIGEAIFTTALALIPFGVGKGLSGLTSTFRGSVLTSAADDVVALGLNGVTRPVATNAFQQFLARNPANAWFPNTSLGYLLNLNRLAKTPILPGGTSFLTQNSLKYAQLIFGAEIFATAVDPLMGSVIDADNPFDGVETNTWQDANW